MTVQPGQIYEDTKGARTLKVLEVTPTYVRLLCLENSRETWILLYNFERLKRFQLKEAKA